MPTIKIKPSSTVTAMEPTVTAPDSTPVSAPTLEMSEPTQVVPTDVPVKSNFSIPKNLFSGFADVLRAEQLKLAQKCSNRVWN